MLCRLALKCIFEPVEPTKFGPFILQGTFLKRQREVSAEFADFFVDRVLTSKRMWENMVNGIKAPEFRQLLKDHTCGTFVPEAAAQLAAEGPLLKLGAEEMALAVRFALQPDPARRETHHQAFLRTPPSASDIQWWHVRVTRARV